MTSLFMGLSLVPEKAASQLSYYQLVREYQVCVYEKDGYNYGIELQERYSSYCPREEATATEIYRYKVCDYQVHSTRVKWDGSCRMAFFPK